ncbi:hypothetical protein [Nocardia crassostreae]|uniref:hypothetical protein n=1 Tax=Nocardia crassostreae TaxID=53428 RepID=UPI00083106F9|nr:hypothetical protein [Nocardia crassostreae]
MRIRTILLTAATTVAAVLGGSATGLAESPQPAAADIGSVRGEARIVDRKVVLHTELGTLRGTGEQLQILDPQGTMVGAIPLTITRGDTAYPIDAHIDGGDATLTPRLDRARPLTDAERHSIAEAQAIAAADGPEDRFNTAMGNVNNELTVALAVGTLLGAIIGGPIGCVALGLLGLGGGAVLTAGAMALPAAIVGCLTGAVTGAGMGVIVFNLLIGVPALIASAVHFFNVMNAPPAPEAND